MRSTRIRDVPPSFMEHRSRCAGRTAVAMACLTVILSGCSSEPSGPQGEPEDDTPPVRPEITLQYVERLPVMEWVRGSDEPAREGWPEPGQEVTWRLHLRSSASESLDVELAWTLDDEEVKRETVSLPADATATADLPWTWTFDRHVVGVVVDPDDRIEEQSESNNELDVFTDALSVGFYVERSVFDYFDEHQSKLGIGSTSFEDWAQRQIDETNRMFEEAVYPETPDGVVDRWRLDGITVVQDGALPLVPVEDQFFDPRQAVPNLDDRAVDLQWGFPAERLGVYDDVRTASTDNQFYYSGFVQHELGHARYLVDVYGFRVTHGTEALIEITEAGEPVAGSEYMPGSEIVTPDGDGTRVYATQQGLMNTDWTFVDRHSAGALNRIAGHRATLGNFNSPENLGAYLDDLPAENRLTVTDDGGAPLAGALVQVYRSEPDPSRDALPGPYPKHFDDEPDLELTADEQGRVLLGPDPFSGGRGISHDGEISNCVVIVRVETDDGVGYGFLDITAFNQAYWRGETELADYELAVELVDR